MEAAKGDHSDRTDDTVVRRLDEPDRDDLDLAIGEIISHVIAVERLLEKAVGALARVQPKPIAEPSEVRFCSHHQLLEGPSGHPMLVDVYRAHLCWSCYDWTRSHNRELPPIGFLEAVARVGKLSPPAYAMYQKAGDRMKASTCGRRTGRFQPASAVIVKHAQGQPRNLLTARAFAQRLSSSATDHRRFSYGVEQPNSSGRNESIGPHPRSSRTASGNPRRDGPGRFRKPARRKLQPFRRELGIFCLLLQFQLAEWRPRRVE